MFMQPTVFPATPESTGGRHEVERSGAVSRVRDVPRLWLGRADAGLDETFLRYAGIRLVVSCAPGSPARPCFYTDLGVQFCPVPIGAESDVDRIAMQATLTAGSVLRTIGDALAAGAGVLVHCPDGRQQSAALVVAFVLAYRSPCASLEEAVRRVRSTRPTALAPHTVFREPLEAFHRETCAKRSFTHGRGQFWELPKCT